MRVLRVITRMNIGGPSVHATLLSTGLDPQRFSTCLVVGESEASEGDLSACVQESAHTRLIRLKTLQRSLHPWSDLLTFIRLLGMVWRQQPHVLHTHMAKAGALGRMAGVCYNVLGPGRRPGRRVTLIHTFHGHVLSEYFSSWISRLFVTIEQVLARRTDYLIAVSRTVRDDLLARGIGEPRQWRVVPLGLDLAVLASIPRADHAPVVRLGMVGRLVPVKNPSLLLQALHRLTRPPHSQRVEARLVGDGELRHSLEQEARQLGLEGLLEFTGWQQDLRRIYEGMHVVCLTSVNEGTPVSLIEAMAAGCAVVATDVGGVRDLLDDAGECREPIPPGTFRIARRGLLVRSGDVEGFTAALSTLVADVDLRRQLIDAARPHAIQTFDAQRLLRDIATLYEQRRLEG